MPDHTLSRRSTIKLMLAAGGAVGIAGFLPNMWKKPVVKFGVLPAHAQSSDATVITLDADVNCYLDINNATISPAPTAGTLVTYSVTGVDGNSDPLTISPDNGSGNTDATGFVDFSDQLDYGLSGLTLPVTVTIIVTAGIATETFTRSATTPPAC